MYKTEQENFWSGEFGDEYISRNAGKSLLASNVHFFSEVLKHTQGINEKGVIEFGCNIGMNLVALRTLFPKIECAGVEINEKAAVILQENVPGIKVYQDSILNYQIEKKYSISLIKGVLIHINPNELSAVYEKLYDSSDKYICIAEYYNPSPVEIKYRGYEDRLFKRDFAGEFLEKFSDTKLVDYGFAYHRDNNFMQDDITWFLISK